MSAPGHVLFAQPEDDEELRLEHRCRMGLLAVGVLHWIVFYLLTQSGPPPASGTGNVTRARTLLVHHANHGVDTSRST